MTVRDKAHHVVSQWTRLGAMFNVTAYRHDVDVERLLLDTARCASTNSRLFILAVTWLSRYGIYVAKHRLARLIANDLEAEHRQTMGLMLDIAREKGTANSHRFNRAIEVCGGVVDHKPLLDVSRKNDFFAALAEKTASALSLKWGRWTEDFELKNDAIRSAAWIVQHNPPLRNRADFKGDLRASILAELSVSPTVPSESELARRCGVTTAALVEALNQLELSGRIHRDRQPHRTEIEYVAEPAERPLRA